MFKKTLMALLCLAASLALGAPRTGNVILVTFDGLRWQEVFKGADPQLMTEINEKHFGQVQKMFWRSRPEERRQALLPFLWGTVAKQGQIFGHTNRGSIVHLTNGRKFSYPGYQEMLCGFPDDRITSNGAGPNPNVTVLEWLAGKPAFAGRVACIASWATMGDIINRERGRVFVNAGTEVLRFPGSGERVEWLNAVMRDTLPPWEEVRWDSLTHQVALEYLRAQKPRVLHVAFDETDDWAHDGNYERVLRSAHQADNLIQQLWAAAQLMEQYRGKTTLIVTTDHGRGEPPTAWRDHGPRVIGAEYIWLAAMGPDTPALGERTNHAPLTQAQIAATLAALLGEDYAAAQPKAGRPIAELLGQQP